MKVRQKTPDNCKPKLVMISDLEIGECFIWSDAVVRAEKSQSDWNALIIFMRIWQAKEDMHGDWITFTGMHDAKADIGYRLGDGYPNKTGQTWNFRDKMVSIRKYPIRVNLDIIWTPKP